MKRQPECRSVVPRPHIRWVSVLFVLLLAPGVALSQPRGKNKPAPADKTQDNNGGKPGKPKVFDFTGLDISGRLRTPQLLYFLERANEELEKASLERRSFIPEMVRSVNEEAL